MKWITDIKIKWTDWLELHVESPKKWVQEETNYEGDLVPVARGKQYIAIGPVKIHRKLKYPGEY